eukprot:TRINITY_DN38236_c0_g1_i1.p1 TRINITY_DN38236_c0_g1~~TRINITY_DN38236_c0_g1_i1.p1  ORF type:complete len:231 (-),score=35.35 TRINITY_DN38236_c0_g1_i1:97-789(-)
MQDSGVKRLIFSSSCTVYKPSDKPLHEKSTLQPECPYGRSKLHIERMIDDTARANEWHAIALRYFNPAGAHSSGLLGEAPVGTPTNLVPVLCDAAAGHAERSIEVYGDDYDTKDGTPIRDYIHIDDIVEGHILALKRVLAWQSPGLDVINLGSGTGYSVKEVITAMEEVSGRKIDWKVAERRSGDAPIAVADARKAQEILGCRASLSLRDIMQSAWNFKQRHPAGYKRRS